MSGRDVKTSLEALDRLLCQALEPGRRVPRRQNYRPIDDRERRCRDVRQGAPGRRERLRPVDVCLYRTQLRLIPIDLIIKSADLTTDFRLFVNGVDTKLSAWTAENAGATGDDCDKLEKNKCPNVYNQSSGPTFPTKYLFK